MAWFFEQWVCWGGEAEYEIIEEKGHTRIEVEEVQDVGQLIGYFRMPVVIEVHYNAGRSIR